MVLTNSASFQLASGIGEGVSHGVFEELDSDGVAIKSYCFADDRGFTPPDMINILPGSAASATQAWQRMGKATSKDPWGRIMYHTFNSIMPWSGYTCQKLSIEACHGGDFRVEEPPSTCLHP